MKLSEEEVPMLRLVADIREAVGDPTGRMMQEELVAHCRKLREIHSAAEKLVKAKGSYHTAKAYEELAAFFP